jgi:hypothetical protein
MSSKNTNNYNKNYFTANGIPQFAAETVTEQEKQKLAQSEKQARRKGAPGENAEIARAMGRKRGDQT